MTRPFRERAILIATVLLVSACNRANPPAEIAESLERQTTTATIRHGRVLVPDATVTVLGGAPGVFVVDDGTARFRMIRTGKIEGAQIEVLSGLTGHERLVAGELGTVHDGSRISSRDSMSPSN